MSINEVMEMICCCIFLLFLGSLIACGIFAFSYWLECCHRYGNVCGFWQYVKSFGNPNEPSLDYHSDCPEQEKFLDECLMLENHTLYNNNLLTLNGREIKLSTKSSYISHCCGLYSTHAYSSIATDMETDYCVECFDRDFIRSKQKALIEISRIIYTL